MLRFYSKIVPVLLIRHQDCAQSRDCHYNSRLLPKSFTATAKAALILAGAGFGLIRGLRLLEGLTDRAAEVRAIEERLEAMQSQILALQSSGEIQGTRLENAVSADDLSAALDKAFVRVQSEIDARLEDQARSVEALRAMVRQTDELLERLLDRLEAMRSEADLQQIGA